jgi:hypothetical protein
MAEDARKIPPAPHPNNDGRPKPILLLEVPNGAAQAIRDWATERRIQRRRNDRRVGSPEKERLAEWVAILDSRGIREPDDVFAVLDRARSAADRLGEWRNWAYLTLQIQLAVERFQVCRARSEAVAGIARVDEDPGCAWAAAKRMIRSRIPETAFLNWFAPTREVEKSGAVLTIAVPDEPTRCYIEGEYRHVTQSALASLGINEVHFVVPEQSVLPKMRVSH